LPMGASCSFSPPSVTPGTNAVTSTLTISTSSSSAWLRPAPPSRPLAPWFAFWIWLPGIALAGRVRGGRESQRRGTWFWLLSGLLLVLLALAACGGGPTAPSGNSTSPGGGTQAASSNYSVTIVGTSGSAQQSTTATLTVQ
jgi:hypothetical protein